MSGIIMVTPKFRDNRLLRTLQLCINLLSSFLVFPYTIQYDKLTCAYKVKWSKCRTVLCGLASTVPVLSHLSLLYVTKTSSNPLTYFQAANVISGCCFTLVCLWTIWLKSHHLVSILKFFQDPNCPYNNHSQPDINEKWLILLLLLTSTPVAVILDLWKDISDASWDLGQLTRNQYKEGLGLFGMTPDPSTASGHGAAYIFIIACRVIENNFTNIFSCSCEWLVLSFGTVLYYWMEIYSKVVRNPEASTREVQEYYTSLKTYSKAYNGWLGALSFMHVLGSLPYFVSQFYNLVQPRSTAALFYNIFNLTILLGVLALGAVIDKKAAVTKEWLSVPKHHGQMDLHQFQILLLEAQNSEIGFYGFGIVKYTIGLLGSIISLLVTFAIIMLQFKEAGTTEMKMSS